MRELGLLHKITTNEKYSQLYLMFSKTKIIINIFFFGKCILFGRNLFQKTVILSQTGYLNDDYSEKRTMIENNYYSANQAGRLNENWKTEVKDCQNEKPLCFLLNKINIEEFVLCLNYFWYQLFLDEKYSRTKLTRVGIGKVFPVYLDY